MQEMELTIFSGDRTICRAGEWGSESEWSQQAKLYLPVRGQGWVAIRGKRTRLRAGHLYLIPPRVRISYGTAAEIVIDWLHFQPRSLYLDGRLGAVPEVHLFNQAVTARFKPACRSIARFIRERSTLDALCLHAMLLELMALTLKRLPQESSPAILARERLMPAIQFLDEQAIRHPSLREVARRINVSPEHCHRLFQEIFHTTPHQYALARRMMLAQGLLSEGTVSVGEAAERCGYADPFYFSRVFRRYFGVSPGRVRRGQAVLGPRP
jgi:AraC-like DNA-binding protein